MWGVRREANGFFLFLFIHNNFYYGSSAICLTQHTHTHAHADTLTHTQTDIEVPAGPGKAHFIQHIYQPKCILHVDPFFQADWKGERGTWGRLYFNALYTFYFAYFCIICFIYGTWALINGLTLFPCPSYQRVDVIFATQIFYINREKERGRQGDFSSIDSCAQPAQQLWQPGQGVLILMVVLSCSC